MFGLDKLIEILFGFLAELFNTLFEPLADIFPTFPGLIFGTYKEGELLYSTFTVEEFTKTVGPGMALTQTLAGFFLFAGFLLAVMRLSGAGINPSHRTALLEFIKDWFLVTIVIMNLTTVYDFILTINSSIVGVFKGAVAGMEDPFTSFSGFIESLDMEGNKSLLSWIVLQLVQIGLAIWASFYYLMRKFTLIILMILGPIFISLWMFPQFKGLTMNYFREFIGTTLTQAIHALMFWLISLISFSASGIETVLLMVIFIPTSEAIKGLFGVSANMTGVMHKAGAMFGMSALAGIYGSVKGALDGKGVYETIKSAGSKAFQTYQGNKGANADDPTVDDLKSHSSMANAGSTLGSTDRAERMLKAGDIMSKAGKMILGSAGAIIGSPMGPGGAIVGSTAGSIAGGVSGGLAGRTGYAIGSTISRSLKDGWKKAKEGGPQDLADAIAEEKTNAWAALNEASFKEELKNRGFNEAQQEALWNTEKQNKFNQFKKEASADLMGIDFNQNEAKVRDLRQKTAEDLTNHWKKQNEQAFKEHFKSLHPNARPEEIEAAWNKEITRKAIENYKLVNDALRQTFENTGKDRKLFNDNAFIPKDVFKDRLIRAKQEQSKIEFAEKLRQTNPNITNEAIEKAFTEKAFKEACLNDQKVITSSIASVKGGPLLAKGSINKEALATHMAFNATQRQKNEYMKNAEETALSKGIVFDSVQAEQLWNQREEAIYQDNLREAQMLISKQAGKQIIRKEQGKIHGTGRLGQAELKIQAAGRFVSGTLEGLAVHSGVQGFITDFKDSRFGKAINAAGAGYYIASEKINEAYAQKAAYTAGEKLVQPIEKAGYKIVASTFSALKEGFTAYKNHRVANPIERQARFRDRISFTGGLIGGESGYQHGAILANRWSPYKTAAQQQAMEITEIMQQVETVYDPSHPSGETIAEGALQIVVDQNQSYVQMRTKQGEVKRVSIIGAGDSTLRQGQIAYQNLTISPDGFLTPKGSFYTLDSTGGKVALSHKPNINAQRLIGNRSTVRVKAKPVTEQVYLPYNADVDAGRFYMHNIKAMNVDNTVTVVYEHDKTYVIQKDVNGKEYRVSQFGPGEPSLNPGERIYSKREIVGHKLVKTSNVANQTYFYDQDGKQHPAPFEPELDVNQLIHQRENKRYIARQLADQNRGNVLSGSNRVV